MLLLENQKLSSKLVSHKTTNIALLELFLFTAPLQIQKYLCDNSPMSFFYQVKLNASQLDSKPKHTFSCLSTPIKEFKILFLTLIR